MLSKLDPELPEVASSYVIKSGFHMQALRLEAPALLDAHSGCPNHLDACMSEGNIVKYLKQLGRRKRVLSLSTRSFGSEF